ncbi:hypothetical protein [Streptomyces sp. NBC_01520]|uniref:hypothetical protein n=1 Tax=Streptomyces sp. NBC_01520 TaxID=2903892 RepID=UPI0038697BD2
MYRRRSAGIRAWSCTPRPCLPEVTGRAVCLVDDQEAEGAHPLSVRAAQRPLQYSRGRAVDQSRVAAPRQRDLSSRSINVRGVRDRAVDAWIDDDVAELDAIWDEIIQDLGSDCDSYSDVSSIGLAA